MILAAYGVLMIYYSDGSDAESCLIYRGCAPCDKSVDRLLSVAVGIPELGCGDVHLSDHKLTVGIEAVAVNYLS